MYRRSIIFLVAVTITGLTVAGQGPRRAALGDWPEIRGPQRDGASRETGLPEKWSLNGENLLWRVPYGGRSAPIVMGNRVYVQNPSGHDAALQERVMALDADTGKVIWEYKYNIFQSDVPKHRIAWASPAADPETGNIYALSGGAQVLALSKDGKLLWTRSFGEEYAAFTTHGGRTMSPLVDGDLVIVSAAVSNWGTSGNRTHRFIAMDKRTGDVVYVANPGGRPYDTAYATPLIATINGMRLLIAGLGDGAVHAIKPQTGEKVWSFVASKRAINTGVAVRGNTVFISHGDENLDSNEPPTNGLLAAIDGTQTGDIKTTKWAIKGIELGYSSPLIDGTRLYQIDNKANLKAFDSDTGKELWSQSLGTVQKAPPVLADGKIYVGTESGKFFIIRPGAARAEILSSVQLPPSKNSCCGSEGTEEQIYAGAAVSRGRVFFVSSDAIYAIGPKQAKAVTGYADGQPALLGSDIVARTTLRRGDSGVSVRIFQGLIGADPDGDFGPRTEDLVRTFQQSHGLTPNGIVGPETWNVAAPPEVKGPPAWVQVVPTEMVLKPGQRIKLHALLFDAKGLFLGEENAAWSLDGLKGAVAADGALTVATDNTDQAGLIKAKVGNLTGESRARVARTLPWTENFESYAEGAFPPGWVNMVAGKLKVVTLNGQKSLQKPPDETIFKRIRTFVGPVDLANYTFEADVRATEQRRQMGDVGITAQRYSLVLYGTDQYLKIEPWEPETTRTVKVKFAWKPDTWYRLKLRVENLADGKVRARGKAWLATDPEPEAWLIDVTDPIGNRQGAPGLFIDAQFGAYVDNFALKAN